MYQYNLRVSADSPNPYKRLELSLDDSNAFHKAWNVWRHRYSNYDQILSNMRYCSPEYIEFMQEARYKFINVVTKKFGYTKETLPKAVAIEIDNWFIKKLNKAKYISTKEEG